MFKALIVILISFKLFPCEIVIKDNLVYQDQKALSDYLNKNQRGCDKETVLDVSECLSSLNGLIPSSELKKTIRNLKVALISNKSLELYSLESLLSRLLNIPKDQEIQMASLISNIKYFKFNNIKDLSSTRSSFDLGENNTKLLNRDNNKLEQISFKLLAKVKAYKLRTSLNIMNNFQDLQSSMEEEVVLTEEPNLLVRTNINLDHYKINRSINAGELLRMRDITPRKLVRFGKTTKVFINEKGLLLQMKARAKKDGILGEEIELENIATKRKFFGKVISHNTVRVDL